MMVLVWMRFNAYEITVFLSDICSEVKNNMKLLFVFGHRASVFLISTADVSVSTSVHAQWTSHQRHGAVKHHLQYSLQEDVHFCCDHRGFSSSVWASLWPRGRRPFWAFKSRSKCFPSCFIGPDLVSKGRIVANVSLASLPAKRPEWTTVNTLFLCWLV